MQVARKRDSVTRARNSASPVMKAVVRDVNMRKSLLIVLSAPLFAQDALSLRDAVRIALHENKSITATDAAMRASASRIDQARAGRLPKVNYAESFARS